MRCPCCSTAASGYPRRWLSACCRALAATRQAGCINRCNMTCGRRSNDRQRSRCGNLRPFSTTVVIHVSAATFRRVPNPPCPPCQGGLKRLSKSPPDDPEAPKGPSVQVGLAAGAIRLPLRSGAGIHCPRKNPGSRPVPALSLLSLSKHEGAGASRKRQTGRLNPYTLSVPRNLSSWHIVRICCVV